MATTREPERGPGWGRGTTRGTAVRCAVGGPRTAIPHVSLRRWCPPAESPRRECLGQRAGERHDETLSSQIRLRSRAMSESLTALVTAALIWRVRSSGLFRLASRVRRSRSLMARRRTSSVLSAAVDHRVGQQADGGLEEPVEVRLVQRLVDEVGRRRQGPVGLHPVHGPEQPGPQRVDLGVGGRSVLRELQRERFARDVEAAGRAVEAEDDQPFRERLDAGRDRIDRPDGTRIRGRGGSELAAAVGELNAEDAARPAAAATTGSAMACRPNARLMGSLVGATAGATPGRPGRARPR